MAKPQSAPDPKPEAPPEPQPQQQDPAPQANESPAPTNPAAPADPAPADPAAPPDVPMTLVRRGRFLGTNSRGFDSVPFGERMIARPGQEHDVRDSFSYLWKDPQFDVLWEWLGDPELVPAVNEGQVPAR